MAGRQHRIYQSSFFGKVAKGTFQRFDYPFFKGFLHGPNRDRTGAQVRAGILYIEIVFQPSFAVGIIEHSDAGRTTVDPTAKAPVPVFQFQNCGGIGALCVDQDLLIEGAFVVVTRSTEKSGPSLVTAGDFQKGVVIKLGDKLILACQLAASFPGGKPCYRSGSCFFFAFLVGPARSCSRASLS